MAQVIDDGTLVRALVNLEARTPRLQAAVQRAEEACTDLAIEAAAAETDEARRAMRSREAALATDLENARAVLAGHLVAVEAAKGKMQEARQNAAQEAQEEERKRFEARGQELAQVAAEHCFDLDEAVDLMAACFKRVQEHTANLWNHINPALAGPERNELAFGMTRDALLRRVTLRASLRGLPMTGHMLDPTTAPLPKAAAPLLANATVAALLDLHEGDERDGRTQKQRARRA